MKILKTHKSFNGSVDFWEHDSKSTGTAMKFSTFRPAGKTRGALIWLSGLTCTEENFMAKAGAQRALADAGLMVICPDTSPRGLRLPHEHADFDFGVGASFYVDATTPGYRDHYRMYTYIAREIYGLLEAEFGVEGHIAISGHSMGGHGALTIGLRESTRFRSISAFAPIVHPMEVPWGQKAFRGYLGEDPTAWREYDACALLRAGLSHPHPILIDQGDADQFLERELKTPLWEEACRTSGQRTHVRMRAGYDHSYYFISTFIEEHIRYHAELIG